jgi:hypothetical protein
MTIGDLAKKTAIIWHREDSPPKSDHLVLLWNSFEQIDERSVSVPRFIEDHDIEIRRRLLAGIRDVKLARVDGKSVAQHLSIDEHTSYWWLTLFALKRWTGSSNIPLACKVIAAHMSGADKDSQLWPMLMLELWARSWLD